MKVTIITATRNNASTLDATISSVMSQTHRDIDYIIIDGASTDNSIDIIRTWQQRHPDKIRYISEPDSGVYNAINKGISMAQGDIIGILHGNDFFSSQFIIENIVQTMNDNNVKYIYGDVVYINNHSKKIVRYYSARHFSPQMLLMGIAPPHPSLYVRRDIFSFVGLYKEDYLIGADFDFFIRLMLVKNITGQYLPINMVTMTSGGLSTQFYHRIFTNNREKYRALSENGFKIKRFALLKRYFYIFKHLKH